MAQKLILSVNNTLVTAGFKNANYRAGMPFAHFGADHCSSSSSTTVYANGNGTVVTKGNDNVLGNVVVVKYPDVKLPNGNTIAGVVGRYYHLAYIGFACGHEGFSFLEAGFSLWLEGALIVLCLKAGRIFGKMEVTICGEQGDNMTLKTGNEEAVLAEDQQKVRMEKIKLDELLKDLFSASQRVLVALLNALFGQDFREEDVEVTLGATEFVTDSDTLGIIRADMFFDVKGSGKPVCFHVEFQLLNDGSMVIRMLQYGIQKAIEKLEANDDVLVIPHQKVIFMEKNAAVPDKLRSLIVFPDGQEVNYEVEVLKYWEYSKEDLVEQKMYPLIPLQLFKLRKDIRNAFHRNDQKRLDALAQKLREVATDVSRTTVELFEEDEIIGGDLHKMLLAVDNLSKYLNRTYLKNDELEAEVSAMTKSLYDPAVDKAATERTKIEAAMSFLDLLDDETIAERLNLDLSTVKSLRLEQLTERV